MKSNQRLDPPVPPTEPAAEDHAMSAMWKIASVAAEGGGHDYKQLTKELSDDMKEALIKLYPEIFNSSKTELYGNKAMKYALILTLSSKGASIITSPEDNPVSQHIQIGNKNISAELKVLINAGLIKYKEERNRLGNKMPVEVAKKFREVAKKLFPDILDEDRKKDGDDFADPEALD